MSQTIIPLKTAPTHYGTGGPPGGYRASLRVGQGPVTLCIEQICTGGAIGPAGLWHLSTLVGVDGYSRSKPLSVGDRLAIDYGQGWFVEGITAVITEALRIALDGT